MEKVSVILDCDCMLGLPFKEVDDGLAILYLLGEAQINLMGITTTFGNGSINQVYTQTSKLMAQWQPQVAVYKGADSSQKHAPTPAARFLVEQAAARPGEISLVAIGALSNLKAAHLLDATFHRNLKQIVCMGGYTAPLKLGWRKLPELNFSCDPDALADLLQAECPVTIFPAQTCLQAALSHKHIRRLDFWQPDFQRILMRWLWAFGGYCGINRFFLWDLLPVVYLLHPALFDENCISIKPDMTQLAKGMLQPAIPGEGKAINLPTKICNPSGFHQVLVRAWQKSAQCVNAG